MTLPFPHSRLLAKDDFLAYPEPLRTIVGQAFGTAREQHSARQEEYIAALGAIQQHWGDALMLTAVDVGGDGSPFGEMLRRTGYPKPTIVDPAAPEGRDLHQYLDEAPRLAKILTCLSVLEHLPPAELPQFLEDLCTLLAPGGILYLTADCAYGVTGCVKDTYHFAWMRQQIFSVDTWLQYVLAPLQQHGLWLLDEVEYARAVEPFVYDYGFISAALIKPRRRRSR